MIFIPKKRAWRTKGLMTMLQAISDWDAVYANSANIPNGDSWPGRWIEPARAFRESISASGRARLGVSYGSGPRNRMDVFLPEAEVRGLMIFVHGGYWMALDRSYWSHLASGALAHGYAVAMPEYTLCPENRISQITGEIGAAISAAAEMISGPVVLAGHSAGGHLVSRMVCENSPLPARDRDRIAHVLSISGLHDLRPMLRTSRSKTLRLDSAEAAAESPALLTPIPGTRISCWVGASETSEFKRQNALLANIWRGLGAATACIEEPDRHHFNIIDALANPEHPMVLELVSALR